MGFSTCRIYASAPVFRSIAGGKARVLTCVMPAIRMNSLKSRATNCGPVVGDDRFVTLAACRKAEEPRPEAKTAGATVRATARTSPVDGSLQFETERSLGELPAAAGRCFSLPSVALRAPSARLKQRWETGIFYFACFRNSLFCVDSRERLKARHRQIVIKS
jgi:hypothetical protein